MGKHFSEDSRVKIPALVHLSRLGYQYLSTKEIRTQVHKSTNIFPPSLLKALNKLNEKHPAAPLGDTDMSFILSQLESLLLSDDLGEAFYHALVRGLDYRGELLYLADFHQPDRNIFQMVTEMPCEKDGDSFRPDITLYLNGLPLAFVEVKIPDNKEGIQAESALDRYKAAVEAGRRHPELRVRVDDIELRMPPPQYTIKTLDALKQREPDNDFTLVMGADNLENIHNWRDFRRILSDYGVVVYPRKGFDLEAIRTDLLEECKSCPSPYVLDASESVPDGFHGLEETLARSFRIEIISAPMVDISSTMIREGIAAGKDMSRWLM